jgi:hypothetical protein
MNSKLIAGAALASAFLLTATYANAETMTPDRIKAEVIGNTVGGGMEGGIRFTEFYAANGDIFGLDAESKPYKGRWTIEGPGMCFRYEGVADSCFEMRSTGNVIEFYDTAGKFQGVGTLQLGDAMKLQ